MSRIISSAKIDGHPLVLSRTSPTAKASFDLHEHAIKQASEAGYGDHDRDSIELASHEKQGSDVVNKTDTTTIAEDKPNSSEVEMMVSNQHYSAVAEQALIEKKALEAERKQIDIDKQQLEQERQEFYAEIENLKQDAKAEAKKSGHAEGFKEGLLSAEKEHDKKMSELDSCIETIKQIYAKEVSGLEDICLELVFESLGKILGSELQKTEIVTQAVKEIVSKARDSSKIILHVSKKDYEVILDNKEELEALTQGSNIEIVPDGRVMLGGCLLDSADGSLDGRIEMQIQRLKEIFLNVRNSNNRVVK
ncbi:MAG: hypothetical protein D6B28_00190 [Gammaproteobacteria bacterium]|nr:MAG: hypothetical protein D6B28_00190 [Gammaproteobacteria bacterium]